MKTPVLYKITTPTERQEIYDELRSRDLVEMLRTGSKEAAEFNNKIWRTGFKPTSNWVTESGVELTIFKTNRARLLISDVLQGEAWVWIPVEHIGDFADDYQMMELLLKEF